MISKIQPFPLHPHNIVHVSSASSHEKLLSDHDTMTQSDIIVNRPSLKPKIFQWPTILWIGLGILIFLSLCIVVIVPIAVLAGNSTMTISTICPTTAITTTVTSSSLPAQCSNYTTITDATRSPDYSNSSSCDNSVFSTTFTWVRFTGAGGTLLASCPIDEYRCGTDAPGWYSGVYPSLAGSVTSGYVCYNTLGDLCYLISWILITNCNGFYVYYLTQPPDCNLRYCTI